MDKRELSIETSGLNKIFSDKHVLKGLDLAIPRGEIFAFLGPNGAGKTTTLKLLTGLMAPSSGTVNICGYDIAKNPIEVKKRIGVVLEQPFVYNHITGFEFMRFVGGIYNVNVNEQKKKIPELLEMFELLSHSNEVVQSYSHGMKQKLVIASVLLHNPQTIFLDEPLVGLDPKSARLVKEIFCVLSKRGVTVFMCTHVLEIAEKIAHRVGIIQNGRLIALEKVSVLKDRIKEKSNLEDVFLDLTNGTEYRDLLRFL